MLGTINATDGSLRTGDARLIVGKYRSRCCLRKTEIVQELAEKDHLLNHRIGSAPADENATVVRRLERHEIS